MRLVLRILRRWSQFFRSASQPFIDDILVMHVSLQSFVLIGLLTHTQIVETLSSGSSISTHLPFLPLHLRRKALAISGWFDQIFQVTWNSFIFNIFFIALLELAAIIANFCTITSAMRPEGGEVDRAGRWSRSCSSLLLLWWAGQRSHRQVAILQGWVVLVNWALLLLIIHLQHISLSFLLHQPIRTKLQRTGNSHGLRRFHLS